MSRENTYTAIILKKTPYGEADEIITFFSREAGKLRGLAKSVKLAKSKLQSSLQSLFLVNIGLAGSGQLPRIIAAQAEATFPALRENLELGACAFYAAELILKFTPDEQKNEALFSLLTGFLDFLNADRAHLNAGLAKFKAGFLSASGFGPVYHQDLARQEEQLKQTLALETASFRQISQGQDFGEITKLQAFLSKFIVYHLEREVKSERFVNFI